MWPLYLRNFFFGKEHFFKDRLESFVLWIAHNQLIISLWMSVITVIWIKIFNTFFGLDLSVSLQVLPALVLLDLISGILKGASWKAIFSKMAFKGLSRKLALFIIVAAAHLMDLLLDTHNGIRNTMATCACWYELTSVVENVGATGLAVPIWIKSIMDKGSYIHDNEGEDKND